MDFKETYIYLTLTLLTCRIWRAPNTARKWQMGFNSAFKGLKALDKTFFTEFHSDKTRNVENRIEIHFYPEVNNGCH
jgi:hypothetical protein